VDNPRGEIFNIKRFSVHDGPGIRTTVFLKGCPLSCTWCHNPEGINREISVWYNRSICIACGECVKNCPENALTIEQPDGKYIVIDRSACSLNGKCVEVCPSGAITFTGWTASAEEILAEVLKDTVYYESSGGGVTLSGGEPLFQPAFCKAILESCRKAGIDTALETCLYCDRSVLEDLIEVTDHFLVDMKIYDSGLHEKYTGRENSIIRSNIEFLTSSHKDIVVRVPLVKAITDTAENRRAIEEYINKINPGIPVEYLDYNPFTKSKYQKLGREFSL